MATATATAASWFRGIGTARTDTRKRTGTVKVVKPKATPKRTATATISATTFERLTVIQQIKRAFLPGARLAAWVGLIMGGLIPIGTWMTAHYEVTAHPWHWAFVAGGLIYSAETVFKWARSAFGSGSKALGFVILLEGTLTFGTILPVSLAALGVLVFVNAVAAACSLQVRKDQTPAPVRSTSNLTTIWGNN